MNAEEQIVALEQQLARAHAALESARREHHVAQQALRQSEEFKTRIIEGSMDCIKVLDLEGRVLSMNDGGMKVLEICDFGPFYNAPWHEFWPEESRDTVRGAVTRARNGETDRFIGFCPTAIGTPKWWDVAVTPIRDEHGNPDRILAISRDITERKETEGLLRTIAEGTAASVGEAFFTSLIQHLASALGVRYAYLAECLEGTTARSRAFCRNGELAQNFQYNLTGTPCLGVIEGRTCCYPENLQQYFPQNDAIKRMQAEAYIGVPLRNSVGDIIGHMVVIDDKPATRDALWLSVLRTFAGRAGAELERQQADEKLREMFAEVERLKSQLQAENVYLQEEIRREHNFHEMVGNSPALLEALNKVERVAPIDSTVLILGETGSGKELFARAVHSRSKRSNRPLVKVNCGSIAPGLVESELFGHVKGAFTGAIDKRVGRFELADGGTIFLDEIGELPLDAQVKLLRVLQEQEFEPVGSSRTIRVSVRVIAATNRDLEQAAREGRFRTDLLYRLNVFPIDVPPLRARRADIPLLVAFFAATMARKTGKPIQGFTTRSMERMVNYSWPGNVRELQNVVERAAILAKSALLDLDGVIMTEQVSSAAGVEPIATVSVHSRRDHRLQDVERQHILEVLRNTRGVVEGARGAATILGIHPNTLRSRMKKLGIFNPRQAS